MDDGLDLPMVYHDRMLMLKEIHQQRADSTSLRNSNFAEYWDNNCVIGGKTAGEGSWISCKSPEAVGELTDLSTARTVSNLIGNIPRTANGRSGSQIIVKEVSGIFTLDQAFVNQITVLNAINTGNGYWSAPSNQHTVGYRSVTVIGNGPGGQWTTQTNAGGTNLIRTSYRVVAVKANRQIGGAGVTWDDVFDNRNGMAGFYAIKKADPDRIYEILMDEVFELGVGESRKTIRYDFRNLNLLTKFVPVANYTEEIADHGIQFLFATNVGGCDWRSVAGITRSQPVFLSSRVGFVNWAQ